ncbi:hypothetical protein [Bradyrhizobium sp. BRP23]|uniref:hypothetical protein n=1 Tax=Bradyrhizobium sp. BRP23 TaxID=2793820 RepID=UPI001CD288B3|nr:hypothetical protein [Bradyrhizobium sp. BRP23]MCA1419468.1 hypothetical protein [Bradyrhizobium sp. BRP23]
MIRTGGNWNAEAWPIYFIASEPKTLAHANTVNKHLLVAVNEIHTDEHFGMLDTFIANGCDVFIDSGVYNLATEHARAHRMSMDRALSLAPDEIDGFTDLFDKYVSIVRRLDHQVWGYIEIDQGGRDNKIRTRTKLEEMGLRPVPVYHPFNDGWDYFDYLAERYDRICFGNVVQADIETRRRLVATAWERRRKYPKLWIHALGLTASEMTAAWPLNSCDSSTWLAAVRWGRHFATVANKRCWHIGNGFNYLPSERRDAPMGHQKSRTMCGYEAHFVSRTMKQMIAESRQAVGADPAGALT